jgi:hypothetical protein
MRMQYDLSRQGDVKILPVYSNVGIWLSAQRWKGRAKPQSWYLLALIRYYYMEEDSDI